MRWQGGIISHSVATADMPLKTQEVEDNVNAKGARVPMEVVTFEEVRIGAKKVDIRVGWRDDRVMV